VNMPEKKVKLFLYGTLRTGGRLRPYYIMKDLQHNIKLKGYTLVSSGFGYPIAIKKKNKSIVGDIAEVTSEVFDSVKTMEESAGYKTVLLKEHNAYMFVQESANLATLPNFENWLEYAGV
jgi:gamma-glutamylcyclotransferase (GGCT)/AIG2-like uncharacterized protein YtfP